MTYGFLTASVIRAEDGLIGHIRQHAELAQDAYRGDGGLEAPESVSSPAGPGPPVHSSAQP